MGKRGIDRAAVRKVIKETLALRRWVWRDIHGKAVPGEAFGTGGLGDFPLGLPCLKAKDYYFYIGHQCNGRLELVVDGYECSGRAARAGQAWDVDQWQDEQIILSAAASRDGFRILSRIGRTLVAGRDVVLPSGAFVPGVRLEAGQP